MPALYERWVPPKPATKSRLPPEPAISSGRDTKPPAELLPRESEQKSEESKKLEKRAIEELPLVEQPIQDASTSIVTDTSISTQASRKESKKRKRDAQIHGQSNEEDKTTPKKHKTILSKFEKVFKLGEAARNKAKDEQELPQRGEAPTKELHDLVPLPQPDPVPVAPFEPTFSTLPPWLAKPITVNATKTVSFAALGVHSTFVKKLEKQGHKDALAVQSVLLPMLHPGFEQHLGDICVSARTGSGKTLAYLLPIVEALKDHVVSTLSAIIVVPTRQLVDQALKVAEGLCTGTKLKVGTAVGSVPLATEQKLLVKVRPQYDQRRTKKLHEKAFEQLQSGFIEQGGIFDDLMNMPVDHVPEYESGVDILICTPGRLVEHIDSTTGFLLRDVKWLVVDEADQLLNQDFQGWANVLMDALHGETPADFMNAQERLRKRRADNVWSVRTPAHHEVRKIVLSATMQKDLTKLRSLRFKRPRLVIVEDEKDEQLPSAIEGDAYELPSTLDEYAVSVGNGSDKPLYLLRILLHNIDAHNQDTLKTAKSSNQGESSNDSSPDSSTSGHSNSESRPGEGQQSFVGKGRVLIFAKSNENASRLAHLLSLLHPPLRALVKTLTRSSTSQKSKKLLGSFSGGKFKILIASDLASRGLDIPDLTHVINYDMAPSITSYVHRVGRTARAGKEGQAWTLFTKTEAGWFWNQIAKGSTVKRGGKKVKRVELNAKSVTEGTKVTYEEALRELRGAVEGTAGAVE
ncbi:P-loop containing nucleoside triphosphate hydrolase protein [Lojkania enalia]|uniref:ATP-dependent RNA helicase n=1 Tax=Lojkania enalia TaxID=147567 RepID=A0A9P4N6T4_9PLEO|nr:P-loop containing nucleoside triphosphate hydrolase protein [Didymosphaeria enalia]